jgi:hypothetical protein
MRNVPSTAILCLKAASPRLHDTAGSSHKTPGRGGVVSSAQDICIMLAALGSLSRDSVRNDAGVIFSAERHSISDPWCFQAMTALQ